MNFSRFFYYAICFLVVSTMSNFSCQSDGTNGNSAGGSAETNLSKLPSITCFLQVQLLFESEIQGSRQFIDMNGNISVNKQSAVPFSVSGTGVLLEDNAYIGTVKHLYNLSFEELYNSDEGFRANFLKNLEAKGLSLNSPKDEFFQPNIIVAWFALPKTPKIPIANSLKNDPFKIPDGCYPMELIMQGDNNVDLAIFKISEKSSFQPSANGFVLDDIADEANIEKVQLGEDISTWGYPVGIKSMTNQIIEPQPKDARVTATPNASGAILQTDIQSNFGGSGSFILSKKSGKVIGILNEVDPLNPSNINSVPASYMRRLLKDIINNPTTKKKKQ